MVMVMVAAIAQYSALVVVRWLCVFGCGGWMLRAFVLHRDFSDGAIWRVLGRLGEKHVGHQSLPCVTFAALLCVQVLAHDLGHNRLDLGHDWDDDCSGHPQQSPHQGRLGWLGCQYPPPAPPPTHIPLSLCWSHGGSIPSHVPQEECTTCFKNTSTPPLSSSHTAHYSSPRCRGLVSFKARFAPRPVSTHTAGPQKCRSTSAMTATKRRHC